MSLTTATVLHDRGLYRCLTLLSLELREMIYQHVFASDFAKSFSKSQLRRFDNLTLALVARDRRSTSMEARPLPILPELCCVNRQILHESLPVFLRLCYIEIDGRGPTHAFCKLLHLVPGNQAYRSIRTLRVWIPPLTAIDRLVMEDNGVPTHAMHLVMLCGPSLRHLAINITTGCFTQKTRSGWRIASKDRIIQGFDFSALS
jgi:hypothetical protein